ncbi:MAG: general secretion pathway protein E [Pirellulaceae bacterium]|jgi:general secretion pathway protein E
MISTVAVDKIHDQLRVLDPSDTNYAADFIDLLLAAARIHKVSDIHIQPTIDGLEVRWRVDGVLQLVGKFSTGSLTDVVTRIKVLSHLLTYKSEVPQEGRIADPDSDVEMRVSTFPTLHGERAVVRLFGAASEYQRLENIGLPEETTQAIRAMLSETSGAFIITGPAGTGKTTTAYACLRELVYNSGGAKSIVSLEDPIEVALDGVAQSQVNAPAGFSLDSGLRSLLRQDPEVLLVGEIRDPSTAAIAFQASLTGHLLITSFHAGSSMGAISRLADMGIPDYLLRSCILGILSQRLVRRLCDNCKQVIPTTNETRSQELLGLPVSSGHAAVGCERCGNSGYSGRLVVAELFDVNANPRYHDLLRREDANLLNESARKLGLATLWQRACEAVSRGDTPPSEIRRVFGLRDQFNEAPFDQESVRAI